MPSSASRSEPYPLDPRFYDEAFAESGRPHRHYEPLFAELEQAHLGELRDTSRDEVREREITFGTEAGEMAFTVDPVPRIIPATEWDELERGLIQRVRALNAFIADVYSERDIIRAGRVPARVVEGAAHFEPRMRDVHVPHDAYATVAGLDLVRGTDGRLRVLEDNLRTPSGLAYVAAARDVVDASLDWMSLPARRSPDEGFELLGEALRAAAPDGREDPFVVLLSDGPGNSAWYEHRILAARLDVPLVTLDDLEHRAGALWARVGAGARQVDVAYRRTDIDYLEEDRGGLTALGEALLEPIHSRRLACVNAFGSGVADDKLVHAYVEDMVRFYLDEEPTMNSVPTYDLAEPAVRREALGRLDELVVKPRTGHGGHGVVVCPHAEPEDVRRIAEAIRARPEYYIAQETVMLSRHPTVCNERLVPRHVDLRPFIITVGERVAVVPGGLTRVAFDAGAMVVNSSQKGGGKDTWVLT